MNDLQARLTSAGIDTSSLKTLRDVVIEDNEDMADEQETDVEKQYPIYTLATSQENCISLWEQLGEISSATGRSPVILGDRQDIGMHWENRERAEFPAEYLRRAQSCDAKALLDHWREDIFAYDDTFSEADIRGKWNDTAFPYTFKMADLHLKPGNVYIGLFETTISWELPAHLDFGNWNDCPDPVEQVCIQRYWQSRYQSEILAMTHDIVICRVSKPPTSRETALDLAREQMAYCNDIVFQGVGTLDALAASLMNSAFWFFWWD
jgi:hypothetical protein